jgi:hypothetical protein
MPELITYNEDKVILAHSLGCFSPGSVAYCFWAVVRKWSVVEEVSQLMATGRERIKVGRSLNISFKGMPPVT